MVSRIPRGLVLVSLAAAAALALACAPAQAPARTPGVDVAAMDPSVRPGDDFNGYANGNWERATVIPDDRSAWSISSELGAKAVEQTRAILEEASATPSTPDERRLGDFYAAFMDEAAIERRGLAALQPLLDQIGTVNDRATLARQLGLMLRADVDPLNATNFHTSNLFGLWVAQDFNQPTRNMAYLLQGGLAMPDREYYLDGSDRMADIRARYGQYVATVLRLGGATAAEAEAQARRVVALERRIARAHATREQSVDVVRANNVWRRVEFDTRAPGLAWDEFFAAAGLANQAEFIVWHPDAVAGASALAAAEPLDDWKLYLRYIVLSRWSPLLPRAFADEAFAFFGTTLSGTPKQSDRWRRAVYAAESMGDAVGRLYVERHFPSEARRAAEAMVADIKAAFADRVDRLTWMTPETRARAKEKVQTLIVGVGYPDRWRDYSGLTVSRDDALGNALRAEEFEYRYRIGRLGAPVDREEWWMTPQTVNAVNLPVQNAMNFPAAILQPPYFDPKATVANNYGAIGAIIGHEISHSFDDQGSQFDAQGRLATWWTSEDLAHFRAAADQLVAQFNAYKPFPDLAVNGRQTLSENIADLAGLAAAYDAYRRALGGSELPTQAGFSGDQQFFISYAQSWRTKYREPLLRRIVVTDGHAPSMYRAQTVRNLDAWYTAFGVQPGAALYLLPAQRVRLW